MLNILNRTQNNNQDTNDGLKDITNRPTETVKANIIFVHGLGGNRLLTWHWQDRNDPNFNEKQCWPYWLAEDFPDFGVWLFGYQAKKLRIKSGHSASLFALADFLMTSILMEELEKKPLIFITHSMGGLIVKKMLTIADDRRLPILRQTRGVVFIATPHKGSKLANRISGILEKFRLPFLAGKNIKELSDDNPELLALDKWYHDNAVDLQIKHLCLYEMYNTSVVNVVSRDSANQEISDQKPGDKLIPVNADHIAACKFRDKDSSGYRKIKDFLIDCERNRIQREDEQKEHFEEVYESLKQRGLVFFIGGGINLSDNNPLGDLKWPPSDQRIAHELSIKSHLTTEEITGLPCQICPIKPKDRPTEKNAQGKESNIEEPLCPVMKKIDQQRNKKQQLINEQDLLFARLQIRCHGQFIKEIDGSINKILQSLYRQSYDSNRLQNLLVDIVKNLNSNKLHSDGFPLIITTNYDCGIEKAFEQEGKDFDVLYYSGDYDLKEGHIREVRPTWKFIHYSKKSPLLRDKTCNDLLENLTRHPVIVKLYGGEIYKGNSESEWQFAISGINSLKDFNDFSGKTFLPIQECCRRRDILFLGYSATDSELQDIVDFLIPAKEGRERNSKGWLINQSDIGQLNHKVGNYWHNLNIKIDINDSWENYLNKLKQYFEKKRKN